MITDGILRGLLPGWMLRVEREHWAKLMRATLRVVHDTVDNVRLGRLAAMPGQVAGDDSFPHVEALNLIGRDRKLRRGKLETDVAYAARCRNWHEAKRRAGTYAGLLYALRAVLQPSPPRVRLVRGGSADDVGYWWTLDDDALRYQETDPLGAHHGVVWPETGDPIYADSTDAAPWNWDWSYYTGPPEPIPDPSRVWVIIYGPCNSPELDAFEGIYADGLSVFGEADGDGDKYTIGTTATASYVEIVRAVCADFKAAGCTIPWIITVMDELTFLVPESTDPENPDGWWKYHGKIVDDAGTLRRIRARSALGRYWVGTV